MTHSAKGTLLNNIVTTAEKYYAPLIGFESEHAM